MNIKRRFTPETHRAIGIDLDSTIWTELHPYVGVPYDYAINVVNNMINEGYEVIIWTARGGDNLLICIKELLRLGLNPNVKFNKHSNKNLSKYYDQSPKVSFDLLLDDKAYNAPIYEHYWDQLGMEFLGVYGSQLPLIKYEDNLSVYGVDINSSTQVDKIPADSIEEINSYIKEGHEVVLMIDENEDIKNNMRKLIDIGLSHNVKYNNLSNLYKLEFFEHGTVKPFNKIINW